MSALQISRDSFPIIVGISWALTHFVLDFCNFPFLFISFISYSNHLSLAFEVLMDSFVVKVLLLFAKIVAA